MLFWKNIISISPKKKHISLIYIYIELNLNMFIENKEIGLKLICLNMMWPRST